MRRITCRAAMVGLLAVGQTAAAQQGGGAQRPADIDRTAVPAPGRAPELVVPTWTSTTLSNGARLIVSERAGLPLVSFEIAFIGGANQLEPAGKTGLAGFVAAMLSEGTTKRSGDELSEALQLLGTNVGAFIGQESGSISFASTREKFAPTLDLLAEMMLEPAFPAEALERLRARTLVQLAQAKDRTSSIAATVFPKLLYTAAHPYGRTRNESSVKAITRDDLVTLHRAYFQPSRAVITVVGAISAAEAKLEVERALAKWPAGGARPSFDYPAPPGPKQTTIYLVDKPGAAQSTFALGLVGPPRSTPDYYALRVMNTMLGELFQSRLNANIREDKGYSYGVGSGFSYGRGPGPWRAGGDIVTEATDKALVEFMKEIRGITGERPVTDDEMEAAKAALIQSLPGRAASVGGIRGMISEIHVQGLPQDYYQQFTRAVNAVTKEDVVRVARKYLDPATLAIVIVGDRAKIEAPLRATNIAPIVHLDIDGNRITP